MADAARLAPGTSTPTRLELVPGAQHRHPVAVSHGMVAARAHRHLAPVTRHDRHGGESAEVTPERRVQAFVVLHGDLDHGEALAAELEVV